MRVLLVKMEVNIWGVDQVHQIGMNTSDTTCPRCQLYLSRAERQRALRQIITLL